MKQFSSEPYFVVGYIGSQFASGETRFATAQAAFRHAAFLTKNMKLQPDRVAVFVDRVGVPGVHTHHREERGTNRCWWLHFSRDGAVSIWSGLHWEVKTSIAL